MQIKMTTKTQKKVSHFTSKFTTLSHYMRVAFFISVVFITAIPISRCFGQNKTDVTGIVILDTASFWRLHNTLKPPVIETGNGLTPILVQKNPAKWKDMETPEPPKTWIEPDFDDSLWGRLPARRECSVPSLSRLCMRGKFQVTNIARVSDLRLSLEYFGGAVIYLNGKEVVRGNLSAAQSELADSYPAEAFAGINNKGNTNPLLLRKLSNLKIPLENLHIGVNVLAIELVRAPYNKVLLPKAPSADPDLQWSTCFLDKVQLVTSNDGIISNTTRPKGFQVWNSDAMGSDFDLDWGDPCEPVRPVKLSGARNGSYSGKVVVGSTSPIQEIKATVSDLIGESGSIPAGDVHIRYSLPWGEEEIVQPNRGLPNPYSAKADLLGALVETPPKDIPVYQKPLTKGFNLTNQSPVFGAVCPVWVTVHVPKAAKPGIYRGDLTITAKGEKPVMAPVEVRVLDWTLPDPQDYTTWTEFVQSPDTLTVEYGIKPWSEKHWEMIAKTFSLLNEVGSRVIYVPVIAQSNLGNEHGMVYWIKDGENKYKYDFSIMDKYLDYAEKYMGKPKLVCFVVWDVYMANKNVENLDDKQMMKFLNNGGWLQGPGWGEMRKDLDQMTEKDRKRAHEICQYMREPYDPKKSVPFGYISCSPKIFKERFDALKSSNAGPLVTMPDPVTGKLEEVKISNLTNPGSMELWKPLFAQIKERMKKRNLDNASAIGFTTDTQPNKADVQFLHEASGGLPWVSHSHHLAKNLYGIEKVGYATWVWGPVFSQDTGMFGWKNPLLFVQHQRDVRPIKNPAARWRYCAEANITGGQRGFGRMGADFWFALKDKEGKRIGTITGRYPGSTWRNLEILNFFMAAGPDGPVGTNSFEAVREGVQECEARIFIEKALIDETLKVKLGTELTKRAKDILDKRISYMWKGCTSFDYGGTRMPWGYTSDYHSWFLAPSTWQDRSEKLYELAGEVQKKLAK